MHTRPGLEKSGPVGTGSWLGQIQHGIPGSCVMKYDQESSAQAPGEHKPLVSWTSDPIEEVRSAESQGEAL